MKIFHTSLHDMAAATRLTGAGRLSEATALLQRVLNGGGSAASTDDGPVIDGSVIEGTVIEGVVADAPSRPATGRFLTRTYDGHAGRRPYKLYIPASYHGQSVPLVVMLHGCTQSADDFAAGTRMNEAAEATPCLVAYPEQLSSANAQRCWNWFNGSDQKRGAGEPALIAGITQAIIAEHKIDPARVFVAGLSAGGAAAAIMGSAYPELYAAIGVHSGLACGAASDMASAFSAMRSGHPGSPPKAAARRVPAIVFHGDRDTTVHPDNADAVLRQAGDTSGLVMTTAEGRVKQGHSWRRVSYATADGAPMLEQWSVHGSGHAWSGGSSAGSFTDPKGPDATAEMLRFFLSVRR
jgi:poly(hydroxyalkanoate) depolymerase family esterase